MEPQKDAKGPAKPSAKPTGETLGTRTTAGTSSLSASATIPGRVGRFVVQRRLGRGAFGTVYLATDPTLSRDVAIKVPHDGLTLALRERFLREARATAAIHHPNVCPIHEVSMHGEIPFLVMHYVAGTTLAAYLDQHDALPPLAAVAVAQKLAEGMAAAHEKGVTHRDLKPQNVLFDAARMHPVITDFGLATLASESQPTADGGVCGTPAYMSPEQAKGKRSEVGPLSDVYSLGVILYHLLTGEVPFRGPVLAVLTQHANTPPVPPSRVRAGLDPRLDAIVLKAMAKKPSDRYPSAKALADALTEYASGAATTISVTLVAPVARPAAVPPPLPKAAREQKSRSGPTAAAPEPVPGWDTRKWLLIGGAAAALLLTFVAGVLAPRLFRSAPQPPAVAKADEPKAPAPKATPPAPAPVAPKVEPRGEPPAPKPKEPEPEPKPKEPEPKEPEPKELAPAPRPREPEPKKVDPEPPEPAPVPERSKLAVKDGLAWLAKQQKLDGGWEYDQGSKEERVAATGMALRPFLAAGYTHAAAKDADMNKYRQTVGRGLDYLKKMCPPTGANAGRLSMNMYTQAIGTLSLVEAYGATKDGLLKPHAQAAVNYIQKCQGPNGSWGYGPGANGDTSIVGWQIQALDAAKQAGLAVDDKVFKKAVAFLDLAAAGGRKTMYGYADSAGARPGTALTAVGLLCRVRIDGWGPNHPGLIDGVAGLAKNGPLGKGEVRNLYYYYYATRVVHASGGEEWITWNEGPKGADGARKNGMRDWLTDTQIRRDGAALGSWDPEGGWFGTSCGRVGTTAMALVTLQVCNREAAKRP